MANESFRYKVSLNYVNSKNSEIMINSEQIQYIAIDKDYENTNMPVVAIVASIEKNILDDMILNIDNNIVDPLKKVIPDLSFINNEDSSVDIEFVEKKITNNQYFEKNEIEDVLPNTYNYLDLYRLLFLFMCLLGCGFYKI